jgi:hypothetical protein
MADLTNITPLNFNNGIIGRIVMDKKTGVEALFGYISGIPDDYADLLLETRGLAMALQDRGMTQQLLDQACQKLSQDCRAAGIAILITKSDLPFDNRWYIIGDVRAALDAAGNAKLDFPLSPALYDNVLKELGL